MKRVLEPEVMDTWEDAIEYDSMDFTDVNTAFADRAVELGPPAGLLLDAGTGTARIPILMSQRRPQWNILAIDLSQNMLKVGATNVERAGLTKMIKLELVDAKRLPYDDRLFDMVVSNSIVHHLPDPLPFFRDLNRVLKPWGGILLRDLLRPTDEEALNRLVETIGPEYDDHQKKLFGDSLQASFTLDEVRDLASRGGFEGVTIYQSSDRHWTLERHWRPG